MALETLRGIEKLGGFKVVRHKPEEMSWDDFDKTRDEFPINITDKMNTISFKIQNGPVKENGVNGCQVDTMIHAAKTIIEALNEKFPCRENACAITKLDEAIHWLEARTKNRAARGVEGHSKA